MCKIITGTKHEPAGIDWFVPFKRMGIILFGHRDVRWKWLNRIIMRMNWMGGRISIHAVENLKRSRGLKSYYIDYDKFSHREMAAERLLMRFMRIFLRIIKGQMKARRGYIKAVNAPPVKPTEATEDFWRGVRQKAESLGIGLVGFAPVDERYIFTKDHTMNIERLYDNAVVLGMEMSRDAIDTAPGAAAGIEAMRVYADLGIATNILADYIRSQGFGAIACHPMGGPILYPAMAVRAGLGEMGKNGLLITGKYGPRQRLSIISTDAGNLPEFKHESLGVAGFCKKCMKCVQLCPQKAIFSKPVVSPDGTRETHISTELCLPFFYEYSGCSICLKVCPFSAKGNSV